MHLSRKHFLETAIVQNKKNYISHFRQAFDVIGNEQLQTRHIFLPLETVLQSGD